jgi:hypothetical protein
MGQRVETLVSEVQNAGHHQVEWDASDQASGVYFYRLTTDNGFIGPKRMVLLK